ncbi:hypothetical protein MferCBS31731_002465 [Microsporum ferrugineum]
MSNLRHEVIIELEEKKMELQQLMTRQTQLVQFIAMLEMRREELEQLTSSAREAQDARSIQPTANSLDQEIAQHEQELGDIKSRIKILAFAIDLLSQS